MPHPLSGLVPSEGTIEQLSNHFLLNQIGPESAWFYIPTKNEERKLGYDASLQANKLLVIQYKRLRPNKSGGGSIKINLRQHRTLIRKFPPQPNPYVFYAFSIFRDYAALSLPFSLNQGHRFGCSMIFVDAHSIPTGATSISTKNLIRKGCWPYCLPSIAQLFLSCKVGLRFETDYFVEFDHQTDRENPGRINVLWARI